MKRLVRWLLIGGGIILVIAVLRATIFRPKPIDVEAARAERGVVEDAVTNSQAGTVMARRRSKLGVERAGIVVSIPHREGSEVKRGETLLQLDPSSAQVQLDLAERDRDAQRAALQAARAAATLAGQDYARNEKLRAQGVISEEQMDQVKSARDRADADLQAAEAQVKRAESSVRLARDELTHLRVTAPFDGIVSNRYVEVGESVIPGQSVLEITNLDSLYVRAPIDEVDIGRLRVGLPARVTLDPYPGVTWDGVVSRVSAVVNDLQEQNRTLDVDVEIRQVPGEPRPKPGSSADVQILLSHLDDVLRVPTFAVSEGRRVLVVEKGKAVSREVTTGLKNWDWTEITSGLQEGDEVITNLDKQGLKAGVRVAVKPATAPGGAAPESTQAKSRNRGAGS